MSQFSEKIPEKNSSQKSRPTLAKNNYVDDVFHFQENSKKFVVGILTKNLALNLSGVLFFVGLGCSLKWWYRDQFLVTLLKQNLPALNEPHQKISWETSEYVLKEQNRKFIKKIKSDQNISNTLATLLISPTESTINNTLRPTEGNEALASLLRKPKEANKGSTVASSFTLPLVDKASEVGGLRYSALLPSYIERKEKGLEMERVDLYTNHVGIKFNPPWQKHAYQRFSGIFPKITQVEKQKINENSIKENNYNNWENSRFSAKRGLSKYTTWKQHLRSVCETRSIQLFPETWFKLSARGFYFLNEKLPFNNFQANVFQPAKRTFGRNRSTKKNHVRDFFGKPLVCSLKFPFLGNTKKHILSTSHKLLRDLSTSTVDQVNKMENETLPSLAKQPFALLPAVLPSDAKQKVPEKEESQLWPASRGSSFGCFASKGSVKQEAKATTEAKRLASCGSQGQQGVKVVWNKKQVHPILLDSIVLNTKLPKLKTILINSSNPANLIHSEDVFVNKKNDTGVTEYTSSTLKNSNRLEKDTKKINKVKNNVNFNLLWKNKTNGASASCGSLPSVESKGQQGAASSSVGSKASEAGGAACHSLTQLLKNQTWTPIEKLSYPLELTKTMSGRHSSIDALILNSYLDEIPYKLESAYLTRFFYEVNKSNAPLMETVSKSSRASLLSLGTAGSKPWLPKAGKQLFASEVQLPSLEKHPFASCFTQLPAAAIQSKKAKASIDQLYNLEIKQYPTNQKPIFFNLSNNNQTSVKNITKKESETFLKKSQLSDIKQLLKNELQFLINTLPLDFVDEYFSDEQNNLTKRRSKSLLGNNTNNNKNLSPKIVPTFSSYSCFASGGSTPAALPSDAKQKVTALTEAESLIEPVIQTGSIAEQTIQEGNEKTLVVCTTSEKKKLTDGTRTSSVAHVSKAPLPGASVEAGKQVIGAKKVPAVVPSDAEQKVLPETKIILAAYDEHEFGDPLTLLNTLNFTFNNLSSLNNPPILLPTNNDASFWMWKLFNPGTAGTKSIGYFLSKGISTIIQDFSKALLPKLKESGARLRNAPLKKKYSTTNTLIFHTIGDNLVWKIFQQPSYDQYTLSDLKKKISQKTLNQFLRFATINNGKNSVIKQNRITIANINELSTKLIDLFSEAGELIDINPVDTKINFVNTKSRLMSGYVYPDKPTVSLQRHFYQWLFQKKILTFTNKHWNHNFHKKLQTTTHNLRLVQSKRYSCEAPQSINSYQLTLGTAGSVKKVAVDKPISFADVSFRKVDRFLDQACLTSIQIPITPSTFLLRFFQQQVPKWEKKVPNYSFIVPAILPSAAPLPTDAKVAEQKVGLIVPSVEVDRVDSELQGLSTKSEGAPTALAPLPKASCFTVVPKDAAVGKENNEGSSYASLANRRKQVQQRLCNPSNFNAFSIFPYEKFNHHLAYFPGFSKPSQFFITLPQISQGNDNATCFASQGFGTTVTRKDPLFAEQPFATKGNETLVPLPKASVEAVTLGTAGVRPTYGLFPAVLPSDTEQKDSGEEEVQVHATFSDKKGTTQFGKLPTTSATSLASATKGNEYALRTEGEQATSTHISSFVTKGSVKQEAGWGVDNLFSDCNTRKTAYNGIVVQRNVLTKDFQPFDKSLKQSSIWGTRFLGPENPLTNRQCHFFGQRQLSPLNTNSFQRDYLRQLGKETLTQSNLKGFTEKLPSIERGKILSFSKKVNSFFFKKRKYTYLLEQKDHWYLLFQEQLRTALEDKRKYPPLTIEEIKDQNSERIKVSAPLIMVRFPKEIKYSGQVNSLEPHAIEALLPASTEGKALSASVEAGALFFNLLTPCDLTSGKSPLINRFLFDEKKSIIPAVLPSAVSLPTDAEVAKQKGKVDKLKTKLQHDIFWRPFSYFQEEFNFSPFEKVLSGLLVDQQYVPPLEITTSVNKGQVEGDIGKNWIRNKIISHYPLSIETYGLELNNAPWLNKQNYYIPSSELHIIDANSTCNSLTQYKVFDSTQLGKTSKPPTTSSFATFAPLPKTSVEAAEGRTAAATCGSLPSVETKGTERRSGTAFTVKQEASKGNECFVALACKVALGTPGGTTGSNVQQATKTNSQRLWSYFNVANNLQWLIQEPLTPNSWAVLSQWFFLVSLLCWIEQMLLENIFPSLSALEQILLSGTGLKTGDRTHVIRVSKGNTPKFQDLAGVDGLLGELSELVLFLRGQRGVGERLLNKKSSYGVLLTGPPGTGKTFLVRALANEAGVPVLILSAGTLVANKLNSNKPSWSIRHAFRRAKQLTPCILFIDEIDALGKSRGNIVTDINEIVADTTSTFGTSVNGNAFNRTGQPDHFGTSFPASTVKQEASGSGAVANFAAAGKTSDWHGVPNRLINKWTYPVKSTLLQESNKISRYSLCDEMLFDLLNTGRPLLQGKSSEAGGLAQQSWNSKRNTQQSVGTANNSDQNIQGLPSEASHSFGNTNDTLRPTLNNPVTSGDNSKRKFGPLTQLLVSMDGVSNLSGILIMGATNRPELLDPALTRPGRFERTIRIEKPSEQKRIEILQLYSHNLGVQHPIPWAYLANRTRGLTAADLAVAMNYSSLKAIIQGSTHTIETIEYGLDSITRFSNT